MAKKGDMLYAWTNDADIKKKAELGGAVTALWKFALESKMVDAVLAITKGTDLYDAQPVLITNPKDSKRLLDRSTAGRSSWQSSSRSTSTVRQSHEDRCHRQGLRHDGHVRAAKRKQINLDNVVMIGVNCGGSVSPVLARKMIAEKFGVDPDKVHKEEIDKGQFIIEYEGGHKGISMDELEEQATAGAATAAAANSRSPGRLTSPAGTGVSSARRPARPPSSRSAPRRVQTS